MMRLEGYLQAIRVPGSASRELRLAAITFTLTLLVALVPLRVAAQEITASIAGTVTDPSGAGVPGAKVTASDTARGTVWQTVTNQGGGYYLARVPVGLYDIKVENPGFDTTEERGVKLVLNQVARLDFRLSLGKTAQTANVSATAPLLQTDATQRGTVLDSRINAQLPLATRNYVQLTLLTAGAITPNPAGFKGPQATYNSSRPYVNGNRQQENNFILDGMDNNQQSDNLIAYAPSVDAIEEFNVITQNPSAEFGSYMGAVVSVSTKSGTNRYHGGLFEFVRNDKLNANEWMDNFTGIARPLLRWNEFGGTASGPVVRSKLFFFTDYQGSRFDKPATTTAFTVFTSAERTGDFSQLLTGSKRTQLYDPRTLTVSGQRSPFSGNIIPLSDFSAAARAVVTSKYYPSPVNGNLSNNQFNTSHTATNGDQGDLKIDWVASEADRVFGRYSNSYVDNPTTNSMPLSFNTFGHYPIYNGVLGYTRTLSPALVNDLRLGVNYNVANLGTAPSSIGSAPELFGIPGVPSDFLPQMTFSGGYGGSIGTNANVKLFDNTLIQYGDTVLLNHRNHLMTFGFHGERIRLDSFYAGGNGLSGTFTFDGQFTTSSPSIKFGSGQGQPEADFLLGLPSAITGGSAGATLGQRANVLGAFFQDSWHVTPALTLNLGLRYEIHTPWVEVDNRQVNFGLFSGAVLQAGATNCCNNNRALYNQYNGIYNFQPRIGLAWAPQGTHTVIRAAYGLSSYFEGIGSNLRLTVNPPLFVQTTVNYAALGFPATTLDQGDSAISSASNPYVNANLRVWDPNMRPALSNQWNLVIQHQVGTSTTFQVGYVGQKNTHLAVAQAYFQKQLLPDGSVAPSPYLAGNPGIDSVIGNISGVESRGNQSYHALQATVERRLADGLQAQLAYTFSKCMTDSIGMYGDSAQAATQAAYEQNLYNERGEWGRCYYDATQLLTAHGSYDLPLGRHRRFGQNLNAVVNALVGDWQLNGILSVHSGFPLTISGSDNSGTGSRGPRASCVSPVDIYGEQDSSLGGYQWFDPSAFAPASKGTFGTCGVATVEGPGLRTLDLGLSKRFRITERQSIEFRNEWINASNTPILNAPGATVGSKLGLLESSQGARNIHFGLKYSF